MVNSFRFFFFFVFFFAARGGGGGGLGDGVSFFNCMRFNTC